MGAWVSSFFTSKSTVLAKTEAESHDSLSKGLASTAEDIMDFLDLYECICNTEPTSDVHGRVLDHGLDIVKRDLDVCLLEEDSLERKKQALVGRDRMRTIDEIDQKLIAFLDASGTSSGNTKDAQVKIRALEEKLKLHRKNLKFADEQQQPQQQPQQQHHQWQEKDKPIEKKKSEKKQLYRVVFEDMESVSNATVSQPASKKDEASRALLHSSTPSASASTKPKSRTAVVE